MYTCVCVCVRRHSLSPGLLAQTHTHIYIGTCLIRHTKGTGKCVGLYRMSEYSGLIIVSRNTLGPQKTQLSGCTNSTVYAKQLIVFHLDKWSLLSKQRNYLIEK
jgi:hypothetical protein